MILLSGKVLVNPKHIVSMEVVENSEGHFLKITSVNGVYNDGPYKNKKDAMHQFDNIGHMMIKD